jgi:hypothetical protein
MVFGISVAWVGDANGVDVASKRAIDAPSEEDADLQLASSSVQTHTTVINMIVRWRRLHLPGVGIVRSFLPDAGGTFIARYEAIDERGGKACGPRQKAVMEISLSPFHGIMRQCVLRTG